MLHGVHPTAYVVKLREGTWWLPCSLSIAELVSCSAAASGCMQSLCPVQGKRNAASRLGQALGQLARASMHMSEGEGPLPSLSRRAHAAEAAEERMTLCQQMTSARRPALSFHDRAAPPRRSVKVSWGLPLLSWEACDASEPSVTASVQTIRLTDNGAQAGAL